MVVASYYEFNLDHIDKALDEWYPDVRPFYAVKCNPHPLILKRLVSLGLSFDCASPEEIRLIMDLGVPPSKILYAHPCKPPGDLTWAFEKGIRTTTFDTLSELTKIPFEMDVILRIRADDPTATCPLGNKYGAELEDVPEILSNLKHKLVGISFHVGSGSNSQEAHRNAILKTLDIVSLARLHGHDPKIIDIGGGFRYGKLPTGLTDLLVGFEVWGEPGRYFAEHVATLFTPVIGKKKHAVTIDESLYGAFNCKLFDHADPRPIVEREKPLRAQTVFGCTCDGIDVIHESLDLPELEIGDFLIWPAMGAYTLAACTSFNGIPFNARKVVVKKA
jgi:ornithine decarboxylase